MSQARAKPSEKRPLVLHVLYRFDMGGLENGVVNLINRMPGDQFRHAILAIDKVVDTFAARLKRDDVRMFDLNKAPGHALRLYPRIWRLLRELQPAIVHTRNLAALETQLLAAASGVTVRIHGEHGRDVEDLDGTDKKLQRIRRLYSPFVQRYVTVSRDLQSYLVGRVGIRLSRVSQIYNGVDTEIFRPSTQGRDPIEGCPFQGADQLIVGAVGRMQTVKNQTLLAQAFVRACAMEPAQTQHMRLIMVGDGPLRAQAQGIADAAGLGARTWLPGERNDIPELMRGLDAYVLPSLAEGVSNTILEAMATGLPVLATDVGGNAELVQAEVTGELLLSGEVDAMARALVRLCVDRARGRAMGLLARKLALDRFSLDTMVQAYADLYCRELDGRRPGAR